MSKNTRNRILLTALAALLLVVVAVGGTMAWLVDKTQTVTNTFTPSEVDIVLTETTGSNYKMVPGASIAKDPKVTVMGGSEDCWLFVEILESANFDTFIEPYQVTGWTALGESYPGVYYREVSSMAQDQTFEVIAGSSLTVIDTVTNQMLNGDGFTNPTLTITAYAVQKSSFDTAADAWAVKANDVYGAQTLPAADGE